MKSGFVVLLLISGYFAQGQSLKDALYSGKLKNEPGTVIRKGEDLSTKIDTTTRKPVVDSARTRATVTTGEALQKKAVAAESGSTISPALKDSLGNIVEPAAPAPAVPEAAVAPKDNNAVWKEYVNSILPTLKSDVLPSKKIKKGSYSVMVSYTIDTDGQTAVTDVFVAPESDYLKEQVKGRLMDSPRLTPVLNSTGAARKVTKRYSFIVTKE